MKLQRNRSHIGMKIKSAVCGGPQPLRNILTIGQTAGQGHNSDGFIQLRGDVAHSAANDLKNWAIFTSKQLQFINDEQLHILNISPLFPP